MKKSPHWRRRLVLTSGLLVIVGLVAGGIAYATIPGALYGDINGCVKSNGDLNLIDPSAGDTCRGHDTPISWSRGYAQENRRAETFFSADGTYHAVVGSALLGGRNLPFAYVVTAKAIVHPNTSVMSECKLEAWRDTDIPRRVVDESQQGPTAFATHNLQAVVQGGPINLQLSCRAGDAWKVTQASIIGTQVGNAANLLSDDADPHSP
jgi:hypothetical protein